MISPHSNIIGKWFEDLSNLLALVNSHYIYLKPKISLRDRELFFETLPSKMAVFKGNIIEASSAMVFFKSCLLL